MVAAPEEIRVLVDHHQLHGIGIGNVDAQLLASTAMTMAGNCGPQIGGSAPPPFASVAQGHEPVVVATLDDTRL